MRFLIDNHTDVEYNVALSSISPSENVSIESSNILTYLDGSTDVVDFGARKQYGTKFSIVNLTYTEFAALFSGLQNLVGVSINITQRDGELLFGPAFDSENLRIQLVEVFPEGEKAYSESRELFTLSVSAILLADEDGDINEDADTKINFLVEVGINAVTVDYAPVEYLIDAPKVGVKLGETCVVNNFYPQEIYRHKALIRMTPAGWTESFSLSEQEVTFWCDEANDWEDRPDCVLKEGMTRYFADIKQYAVYDRKQGWKPQAYPPIPAYKPVVVNVPELGLKSSKFYWASFTDYSYHDNYYKSGVIAKEGISFPVLSAPLDKGPCIERLNGFTVKIDNSNRFHWTSLGFNFFGALVKLYAVYNNKRILIRSGINRTNSLDFSNYEFSVEPRLLNKLNEEIPSEMLTEVATHVDKKYEETVAPMSWGDWNYAKAVTANSSNEVLDIDGVTRFAITAVRQATANNKPVDVHGVALIIVTTASTSDTYISSVIGGDHSVFVSKLGDTKLRRHFTSEYRTDPVDVTPYYIWPQMSPNEFLMLESEMGTAEDWIGSLISFRKVAYQYWLDSHNMYSYLGQVQAYTYDKNNRGYKALPLGLFSEGEDDRRKRFIELNTASPTLKITGVGEIEGDVFSANNSVPYKSAWKFIDTSLKQNMEVKLPDTAKNLSVLKSYRSVYRTTSSSEDGGIAFPFIRDVDTYGAIGTPIICKPASIQRPAGRPFGVTNTNQILLTQLDPHRTLFNNIGRSSADFRARMPLNIPQRIKEESFGMTLFYSLDPSSLKDLKGSTDVRLLLGHGVHIGVTAPIVFFSTPKSLWEFPNQSNPAQGMDLDLSVHIRLKHRTTPASDILIDSSIFKLPFQNDSGAFYRAREYPYLICNLPSTLKGGSDGLFNWGRGNGDETWAINNPFSDTTNKYMDTVNSITHTIQDGGWRNYTAGVQNPLFFAGRELFSAVPSELFIDEDGRLPIEDYIGIEISYRACGEFKRSARGVRFVFTPLPIKNSEGVMEYGENAVYLAGTTKVDVTSDEIFVKCIGRSDYYLYTPLKKRSPIQTSIGFLNNVLQIADPTISTLKRYRGLDLPIRYQLLRKTPINTLIEEAVKHTWGVLSIDETDGLTLTSLDYRDHQRLHSWKFEFNESNILKTSGISVQYRPMEDIMRDFTLSYGYHTGEEKSSGVIRVYSEGSALKLVNIPNNRQAGLRIEYEDKFNRSKTYYSGEAGKFVGEFPLVYWDVAATEVLERVAQFHLFNAWTLKFSTHMRYAFDHEGKRLKIGDFVNVKTWFHNDNFDAPGFVKAISPDFYNGIVHLEVFCPVPPDVYASYYDPFWDGSIIGDDYDRSNYTFDNIWHYPFSGGQPVGQHPDGGLIGLDFNKEEYKFTTGTHADAEDPNTPEV